MTIQEIVQQADEAIHYPFEKIIEKYLPWADSVSDVVCTGIFVMEDVYKGEAMGAQRKQALIEILAALWALAPIPAWAKGLLDKLFVSGMSSLIDKLVAWLNAKFPGGLLKAVEAEK